MNRTQWRNAKKCVEQINRGEWTPRFNSIAQKYLTAERNGKFLWIGNGPWFVDIDNMDYFGLVFRHYVWWAGAVKLQNGPIAQKSHFTPILED